MRTRELIHVSKEALIFIGWLLLLFVSLAVITSCTTVKYVPVEHSTQETHIHDSIRIDSIYQHDSIFLSVKGDTVTKYVERVRHSYKYIQLTDTVHRVDSIPYAVTVEKTVEVERKLKWHERFLMDLGLAALILFAAYLLFRLIKKKFA